jgi:hypothetical protein
MNDDAVRVRQINFRTAVPSLRLLEIIPLAITVQCLIPAFVGTVVLALVSQSSSVSQHVFQETASSRALPSAVSGMIGDSRQLLIHGVHSGVAPLARLLISLLVMSASGIAVSRAAGSYFCRATRTGAMPSLLYSLRAWRSWLTVTGGLACFGVAALVFYRILIATMRMVSGADGLCSWLSVTLWVTTIAILFFLIPLSIGWLLSLASIGIDGCNGPEALSRGISYVISNFWRSVCYAVFLMAITLSSGQIADFVCAYTIEMANEAATASISTRGNSWNLLDWIRTLLVETVKFSVFFSGIAVAYVLLRHYEDNVDAGDLNIANIVA